MNTRHLSFFSLATACVFLTGGAALIGGGGCGGSSSGGSGGSTGSGGSGGGGSVTLDPANKISDFEDLAAATVVMAGTPTRNGYWYTYNDDNPAGTDPTCVQDPKSGPQLAPAMAPAWIPAAPPTAAPSGQTSALALHVTWKGCTVWGAGLGADLNQPALPDGGTYTGKKVPYDVGPYTGITFWARVSSADSDTMLRIKFPMSDETKTDDGGDCVDSPTNKCSDDFGEAFALPTNGNWKQITIKWADAGFKQEGWGAIFTWNPAHVTSIQIQSADKNELYDFWIDDMYFIK